MNVRRAITANPNTAVCDRAVNSRVVSAGIDNFGNARRKNYFSLCPYKEAGDVCALLQFYVCVDQFGKVRTLLASLQDFRELFEGRLDLVSQE